MSAPVAAPALVSLACDVADLPALAAELGAPYAELHCLTRAVGDRVEVDVAAREYVFTARDLEAPVVRRRPFGFLALGGVE